jgi:hypothetical protein
MMQLTAKLIQILPVQTGSGKNGEWKKQDIIVETDGQYPKKICVSIWGDKINESQLEIGNILIINFNVESREYNNRWYTDITAWKIELSDNHFNLKGLHGLKLGKAISPRRKTMNFKIRSSNSE